MVGYKDIRTVECPCCHGTGVHPVFPHLAASPDDYEISCDYCLGFGKVEPDRARRFRGKCVIW